MALQLLFCGIYFQDLFDIARSILVQLLSSFFSLLFISVNVVHPYSVDTTAARKYCILFYRIGLTYI